VPLHLRNAPTKLMKNLGYGKAYRYAHDEPRPTPPARPTFPRDMPPSFEWPTGGARASRIAHWRELAQLREGDRQARQRKSKPPDKNT
jgi:putative ATPase